MWKKLTAWLGYIGELFGVYKKWHKHKYSKGKCIICKEPNPREIPKRTEDK